MVPAVVAPDNHPVNEQGVQDVENRRLVAAADIGRGSERPPDLAPEPATGAMDRVDFSKMWGMGSVLGPGETREWHLGITVSEGNEPSAVSPGGELLR